MYKLQIMRKVHLRKLCHFLVEKAKINAFPK